MTKVIRKRKALAQNFDQEVTRAPKYNDIIQALLKYRKKLENSPGPRKVW